ncbi:MAG TPA: helix-turn-helix transcriptional regulator [Thermoanaerobaculia bacterium]|nr:helix-turn-helix transcriptional regulator [Thermoanaerobaculia bacterium]
MNDPEDLRCVVGLVCLIKGWNRKQLARAAGVHRVTLSRLEHGVRHLSDRTDEAFRNAAGLSPEAWRELFAAVARARREMARAPGEPAQGSKGADPLAGLLTLTSARLTEALEILLAPATPMATDPAALDPENAALAWERLQRHPKETHRALIEEAPEFQTPALAERLGAASKAAAPDDPERSLELANLARRAAELASR